MTNWIHCSYFSHCPQLPPFFSIRQLLFSLFLPLLYTYGKIIPDQAILKKSIRWLEQIPVEQNQVMEGWRRIGISVKKAEGSQALIELKKTVL